MKALKVQSFKSKSDSGITYLAGVGVTKIFDNSILLGGNIDLEYIDIDSKQLKANHSWSYGTDLRVGYNY